MKNPAKLPKIIIIHYEPLVERRKYLEKQLKKEGLNASWFTQREGVSYPVEEISKYYEYSPLKWIKRARYAWMMLTPRKLTKNEITLAIHHFKILKMISKSKNNLFLIFEDDVLLGTNFRSKLTSLIQELNKIEWDMCYLHWSLTKPTPTNKKIGFVKRTDYNFCFGAGAYLIKKDAAKKIIENFDKFILPPDHELIFTAKKLNLKVFWANPPISSEGSFGRWKSSLGGQRDTTLFIKIGYFVNHVRSWLLSLR